MKKYHVIDEDGAEYEIKEFDDEEVVEEEKLEDDFETQNAPDSLSPEEIAALKKLAAFADKLIASIESTTDSDENMEEEDLHDEDEDEEVMTDEDEVIEKEEEVIDTDEEEKRPAHDSKKSFGSIEKRKKADDSLIKDEVANAWAKRYGGR